jgi:hypothetical protein
MLRRSILPLALGAIVIGAALTGAFAPLGHNVDMHEKAPRAETADKDAPKTEARKTEASIPEAAETNSIQGEPTKADCMAAVDKARALAGALPENHLSRYFAERHLLQSMAEAGNGEFDDCLYWAERATEEVQGLRHELKPGETLKIMQPDEQPAKPEPRQTPSEKNSAHKKARH